MTQHVSVGAVRDFYGAIADHLANGKGYFITTNKFTLEAERFVEDKPIELIDSFKLVRYIRSVEKASDKESGQPFGVAPAFAQGYGRAKQGGQKN